MNLQLIKILAKKKKITIKDLSQKIGMSEQGLHRSIRTNSIAAEYLEKVARYFDVSVGIFFGEIDYDLKKKENTLKSIFNTDKDLVVKEWNTIAEIKSTFESEDDVRMAWVGLRKGIYSIIERVKQIPIINICIRLSEEEFKLGNADADGVYEDYKEDYNEYIYYQLSDWIWLLKVLKRNDSNTDEVLTQILYKGSCYVSKSFPDEFFTNDR